MKSKAKKLLEFIPILGSYINDQVYCYRSKRQSDGVRIDSLETHNLIKELFPKVRTIRRSDLNTVTINADEVKALLINTRITRQAYVANDHDCDDYAFAMKGFFSQSGLSKSTFGIMMSAKHAYNFFVDDQKQVWILEPQSGVIFLAKDYKDHTEEDYKTTEYIL